MIDDKIYTLETVCLIFTIKIDGKQIVTGYAKDALATNGAAGFGKVQVSVYDSSGTLAKDANGLTLDRLTARCATVDGASFYLTINPGFTLPDAFTAEGWYGVDNGAGDALGWRGFQIESFRVSAVSPHQAAPPTIP